nr:hypothetical protein [Cylindrospermum stagnale]
MTAEVLIITKMAVALAADSAATISLRALPKSKSKTYNSANKLFALSKNYPVGIMIYGNSEIMSTPLEIIIKFYREKLEERHFKTLKEYYDDFIIFLENFFSKDDQSSYVFNITNDIFEYIREAIQERVLQKIKEEELLEEEVEMLNLEISNEIISNFHETWASKEVLPFAVNLDEFQELFNKNYEPEILEIQKKVFGQLNVDDLSRKKLLEIITFFFCKDIFNSPTDIVIAGFGEDDVFPSMFSFEAECIICEKLKHKEEDTYEQQQVKQQGARVFAFAQSDMINTFTFGIDPALEYFATQFVEKSFNEYSKTIEQEVLKIMQTYESDTGNINELKDNLKKTIEEVNQRFNMIDNYKKEMIKYQLEEHYIPIIVRLIKLLFSCFNGVYVTGKLLLLDISMNSMLCFFVFRYVYPNTPS